MGNALFVAILQAEIIIYRGAATVFMEIYFNLYHQL